MSGNIQRPGLIELPGMKGTIRIRYDLTTGVVDLDAKGMAYPQLLQVLLAAAGGALNEWTRKQAGIIQPKRQEIQEGKSTDGSEETGHQENDDHDR